MEDKSRRVYSLSAEGGSTVVLGLPKTNSNIAAVSATYPMVLENAISNKAITSYQDGDLGRSQETGVASEVEPVAAAGHSPARAGGELQRRSLDISEKDAVGQAYAQAHQVSVSTLMGGQMGNGHMARWPSATTPYSQSDHYGAIRNPYEDIEDEVRMMLDMVEDPCYERYFVQDPVSFIRNDLCLDKDHDFGERLLAYADQLQRQQYYDRSYGYERRYGSDYYSSHPYTPTSSPQALTDDARLPRAGTGKALSDSFAMDQYQDPYHDQDQTGRDLIPLSIQMAPPVTPQSDYGSEFCANDKGGAMSRVESLGGSFMEGEAEFELPVAPDEEAQHLGAASPQANGATSREGEDASGVEVSEVGEPVGLGFLVEQEGRQEVADKVQGQQGLSPYTPKQHEPSPPVLEDAVNDELPQLGLLAPTSARGGDNWSVDVGTSGKGSDTDALPTLLAPVGLKRQLSARVVKNQQGQDNDKAKVEQFTFPVTPQSDVANNKTAKDVFGSWQSHKSDDCGRSQLSEGGGYAGDDEYGHVRTQVSRSKQKTVDGAPSMRNNRGKSLLEDRTAAAQRQQHGKQSYDSRLTREALVHRHDRSLAVPPPLKAEQPFATTQIKLLAQSNHQSPQQLELTAHPVSTSTVESIGYSDYHPEITVDSNAAGTSQSSNQRGGAANAAAQLPASSASGSGEPNQAPRPMSPDGALRPCKPDREPGQHVVGMDTNEMDQRMRDIGFFPGGSLQDMVGSMLAWQVPDEAMRKSGEDGTYPGSSSSWHSPHPIDHVNEKLEEMNNQIKEYTDGRRRESGLPLATNRTQLLPNGNAESPGGGAVAMGINAAAATGTSKATATTPKPSEEEDGAHYQESPQRLPGGSHDSSPFVQTPPSTGQLESERAFPSHEQDFIPANSMWRSPQPSPRALGATLRNYNEKQVEQDFMVFHLKVYHPRGSTGFEVHKDLRLKRNDVIAGRYQVVEFLGMAAFSRAVQAVDLKTGQYVCLKIIKNNKDFFDQSLDEIKLLQYVNSLDPKDSHHLLRMHDFFYYREHLVLVCELLRANLYELQKRDKELDGKPYYTIPRIQQICIQVLKALLFLHGLGIIHSDLKPENILIQSYSRCLVKVIDLGSSCFKSDKLSTYVQSRSYRAPEVILGLDYDQKIDIWSLGAILAELYTGYVLFQNEPVPTILARMWALVGPFPSEMIWKGRYGHRYFTKARYPYNWIQDTGQYELLVPKDGVTLESKLPGADPDFVNFVRFLLQLDPAKRPTAQQALDHPWLRKVYPHDEVYPPFYMRYRHRNNASPYMSPHEVAVLQEQEHQAALMQQYHLRQLEAQQRTAVAEGVVHANPEGSLQVQPSVASLSEGGDATFRGYQKAVGELVGGVSTAAAQVAPLAEQSLEFSLPSLDQLLTGRPDPLKEAGRQVASARGPARQHADVGNAGGATWDRAGSLLQSLGGLDLEDKKETGS